MRVDYAHESTGFPTWHRQYLLWLEWELQYMQKEMQVDNYHMFRLHYWDWRSEMQSDTNTPFKHNRLGVTVNEGGFPRVQGDLVNDGWDTRCWRLDPGEICDPNINDDSRGIHPLQRCPLIDDPCSINNSDWPSIANVSDAINMSSYDDGEYNRFSTSGFRNFMEGFHVLLNDPAGRDDCSANRLCLCGNDPKCAEEQSSTPIARLLHNSVSTVINSIPYTPIYNNSKGEAILLAMVSYGMPVITMPCAKD